MIKSFQIIVLLLASVIAFKNRGHVPNSNLTLYWEFIDEQTFDFEIVWKQYSFVSLMFTNTMSLTDFWVCSSENVISQDWSMNDQWCLNHKRPQNDTFFLSTDDFTNKFAINDSESGTITCGFRRKFNTGDPYDIVLKKGETYTITGMKSTTSEMKKHNADLSDLFYFQWQFEDGFDGEFDEGDPLYQFDWALTHGIILTVCWGLLVDFSLMLVRYFRLMKLYVLAHGVTFFVINFLTLPVVLYMLIVNGQQVFFDFDTLDFSMQIHSIVGIIFIGILTIQHIFGMFAKNQQDSKISSAKNYITMKKIHMAIGYTIYLVSKIELLIGWWAYMNSINFVVKLIFGWIIVLAIFQGLLEFLYRQNKLLFLIKYFKIKNPIIVDKEKVTELDHLLLALNYNAAELELMQFINKKKFKCEIIAQFPTIKFVHFKNMVCNVSNLSHPGGDSLIQSVIGEEISKYIYGGAGVQGNFTKHHRHSEYVLKYLENNVIGIKQQNLMSIDAQSVWTIKDIKEVSHNFFKFTINNPSLELDANPEDITQYVGKFLLVTPTSKNKKANTRTYTLLISQLEFNIIYRNRLLESYKRNFKGNFLCQGITKTRDIVLMVKRYELGTTSRQIHEGIEKIEGLYGIGLELEKGLNVIITGGSGILPFLDLFDTILRKVLLTAAEKRNEVYNYNIYKLNFKSIFSGFKFVVYSAFTNMEEFKNNYEWLIDLAKISKQEGLDIFELHLKIPGIENQYPQIPKFNEFINAAFLQQHMNENDMKKIYVCGPPQMNNGLFLAFKQRNYDNSKFRII